jgi:hypothetical protein
MFYERIQRARQSIEAAEEYRDPVTVLNIDVKGSSARPASMVELHGGRVREDDNS